MQIKDPKPEIMRLEELAILVKSGEIKLPRFQRPFVWKESDMLKLLDSIYKGYPIGSILLWNSSQKLTSERSISGLEVNLEENSFFPTNYLLDGQQRLTTLCGALFWSGIDSSSKWNIHFDLDKQEFVHPKEQNLVNLFPLNKLIQTSDFIRQCMKFDHHSKRDDYFMVAERLLKSIKDYKIAVVKIGDMTIDEVAPIFERINSTGRKLTIVDLMMAATWSDGFDLTAEIHGIKIACQDFGFDDIADPIILRSIAACTGLGINKDDIQRLRSKNAKELSIAANTAKISLLSALSFLRDNIGIADFSYIPYGFQLTYLAEYFRLVSQPSTEATHELVEWFWYTSVTRYFAASSNTGQVSKDLASIRSFAEGKKARLFDRQTIDISKLLFDRFNLKNAASTTFTALINSLNPSHTLDDQPIDGGHLKIKSNKFFGTLLSSDTEFGRLNIARVIHPYPQHYPLLSSTPTEQVYSMHLLNEECFHSILNGNDFAFAKARSALVVDLVKKYTGCDATYRLPTGPVNSQDIDDSNSTEIND